MKLFAIIALLLAAAAATAIEIADNPDVRFGEKIPLSAALEAVKKAVADGVKFMNVDGALVGITPSENPLFRKLKKCNSDDCRSNCNKKGLNGGCIVLKCVCWKTGF